MAIGFIAILMGTITKKGQHDRIYLMHAYNRMGIFVFANGII